MFKDKCHFKKEDKVKIIAGKDKGKIGKVLKVIRKKNRVLVENINVVKRHTRPSATIDRAELSKGKPPSTGPTSW